KGAKFKPNKSVNGEVTAIAYGGFFNGAADADVAYVAVGDGLFLWTAIANKDANGRPVGSTTKDSLADFKKTLYPGFAIKDIVLDPTDWHKGFVVDANNEVYGFVNAGQSAN